MVSLCANCLKFDSENRFFAVVESRFSHFLSLSQQYPRAKKEELWHIVCSFSRLSDANRGTNSTIPEGLGLPRNIQGVIFQPVAMTKGSLKVILLIESMEDLTSGGSRDCPDLKQMAEPESKAKLIGG